MQLFCFLYFEFIVVVPTTGIETGSTIGIYLDLDQCLLSFYCNDEKHGPIEFPSLEDVDVVYPAFSLNRNVTMTLYSGLKPPID